MSPKREAMRASAKPSPSETLMKPLGSHNECSNSSQNQIQSQAGGQDWTEAERAIIEPRFWSKVKKSDGCWLWTASATGGNGMQHGQFTLPRAGRSQRHIYAHRLVWELTYGPIPDGLQVCHKCDVPRCVRPEHLFLGTQDDNLKDAARKGRFSVARTRRLTPADRLAIYHMPNRRGLNVELQLRYRVSKTSITLIRQGRFVGSPFSLVFQRVPHRNLPVMGEVS